MTRRTRHAPTPLLALLFVIVASCGGRAGPPATTPAPARYGTHPAGEFADSAGALTRSESRRPAERPGLGTRFSERLHSRVEHVSFDRAPNPFATVTIAYNDYAGVMAQARYRGVEPEPLSTATPHGGIRMTVTDEYGRPLPGLSAGRTYVVGEDSQRYNLVVENLTAGRYEVVASVDGLDVIDGGVASLAKRGYILAPYQRLVIDGFRTSQNSVAAFRFGAVSESYAARTGRDRNVGVIGFAFFAERGALWTTDELHRRETADPFPRRYAQPPP